jgi:hypothetical protein
VLFSLVLLHPLRLSLLAFSPLCVTSTSTPLPAASSQASVCCVLYLCSKQFTSQCTLLYYIFIQISRRGSEFVEMSPVGCNFNI